MSILDAWYDEHGDTAELEGWSIFDAEFVIFEERTADGDTLGHIDHEYQLQRIDSQDRDGGVQLEDDVDAWTIVMTRTEPHHLAARRVLAEIAPVEFTRILNYIHGWYPIS